MGPYLSSFFGFREQEVLGLVATARPKNEALRQLTLTLKVISESRVKKLTSRLKENIIAGDALFL